MKIFIFKLDMLERNRTCGAKLAITEPRRIPSDGVPAWYWTLK